MISVSYLDKYSSMNEQVAMRPERCHICGNASVHPRAVKVTRGNQVITEAHWICPKCSGRFKVGTVSIETREQKKN